MRRELPLWGALTVLCGALVTAAPAAAEPPPPPPPPLRHVQYIVTADSPFFVDIYYRDTDPPTWSDYSHNPYEFSPRVQVEVSPEHPWVFDAMLADPDMWAMVTAQSGESPNLEPPTIYCTLAVDGVTVKTGKGPKGALCSLRSW